MNSSSNYVYLRIKPSSTELAEETYTIFNSANLLFKKSDHSDKKFSFTKVFHSKSSQADVFEQAIRQRIAEFLSGDSSTIITYGCSNSGKTYTMYGTPESPGIIPRSIELIFSTINCTLTPWYKITDDHLIASLSELDRAQEVQNKLNLISPKVIARDEFLLAKLSLDNSNLCAPEDDLDGELMASVWLSFAEIYNDNIYDLLKVNEQDRRPLKMTKLKDGSTYVKDLISVHVTTALEACQLMISAQNRMSLASTVLNPTSSRSHTFFILKLLRYQKENALNEVQVSTLTFCDLAGSGRSKKSSEAGIRLTESRSINNSLLVLGRCLKTVRDNYSNDNVTGPFRESKLTRTLQKALTGGEKVSFIVTIETGAHISPETLSVLNVSALVKKTVVESRDSKKEFSQETNIESPPAAETLEKESTSGLKDYEDLRLEIQKLIGELEALKTAKVPQIALSDYEELQKENEKLVKLLEHSESNRLNRELEIKCEIADQYATVMADLKASWKKRFEEIEDEGQDLLKWSVNQVETFYKERIDNIMYNKKRKRCDSGDHVDGARSVYEDLETENALITSKVVVLRDMVSSLKSENEVISTDRNKCSFELALVKEELKNFHDLIRIRFPELIVAAEEDKSDTVRIVDGLKRMFDGRTRNIETLQMDVNVAKNHNIRLTSNLAVTEKELCETKIMLQEALNRTNDLENELRKETSFRHSLELQLQSLKKEMATVKRNCNSIRKYSSCCSEDFFCTDDGDGTEFITQAHVDVNKFIKKMSLNGSDPDVPSFFERIESTDRNTFRSSEGSMKEDSGIDSSYRSRRSVSISDSRVVDTKEQWTQTSSAVEIRSVQLENELSLLQEKLKSCINKCNSEHGPKIEKLEKELTETKSELRKVNDELLKAQKLHEKVNDLDKVFERCQEERKYYSKQIQENLQTQSMLELKLKWLSSEVRSRDDELVSLKTEMKSMTLANSQNNQKAKSLRGDVEEFHQRIESLKGKLSCSEDLRNRLEKRYQDDVLQLQSRSTAFLNQTLEENSEKQEEIDRLRLQLFENEREICLFKQHRDGMIQKYEHLVGQLQTEIEKRREQLAKLEELFMPGFSGKHRKFLNSKSGTFESSKIPRLIKQRSLNLNKRDEETTSLSSGFPIAEKSLGSQSSENDEEFANNESENALSIESSSEWMKSGEETYQSYSDASSYTEVYCSCGLGFRRVKRMSGWMQVRRIDGKTELLSQLAKEQTCADQFESGVAENC